MRMLFLTVLFLGAIFNITAQNKKSNGLKLPDPLLSENGTKINNVEKWENIRRPEILEMVKNLMYGTSPEAPGKLKFVLFDQSENALKGKAIRKQVAVYISGKTDYHLLDLLIYLPKNMNKSVPVFLGLNFQGNHAINKDLAIRLSDKWVWIGAGGSEKNHPTERSRGAVSSRWPIEMILDKGYGVATVYAGDLDPDYYDDFKNGIHALYPKLQSRDDNFSTMGAWAWGLSRCMDYFEIDNDIDETKIGIFGFSRMGKAAIWAGANDERFGMVISNESGGGGAALSKRKVGENLARLNKGNRHWFSKSFSQFNEHEENLPFDQHMVLALVAPRPIYVGSAEGDPGSDSEGEFLSLKHASSVYNLFEMEGFKNTQFPHVDSPVFKEGMGYHIRSGTHDIKEYDWQQFLKFADRCWK
ncbi:glucuronyl esterase domain-containing protein [Zunongwangia endophytica]|uniref:Acetylxylan esterase n=1 Tax=Zunongwangia endophytica TaxID=1808945 RepID=A0ABV8H6H0_9FLAO|nr:acetylxylan esterase [Zunongwangia endophytica]MDN3594845.1 acetylxylan esterase [Zunongwangia endophytica]